MCLMEHIARKILKFVKLPEGQGGLHELSLEVGGQKPASPRRLDYEEPKVDDVVPSQVSTQGGDKIVIKGKNLGVHHLILSSCVQEGTTLIFRTRTKDFP